MRSVFDNVRWPRARTRISLATRRPVEPPDSEPIRHQAALAYLSRKALLAAPSSSLLADVCRIAGRVLGADHVHVLELLPGTNTLIARAAAGWPPERLTGWHMALSPDSRLSEIMRTGTLVMLDEGTDRGCSPGSGELLRDVRMRCGLVLGVKAAADAHALLGVYSSTPRRFSKDEVQFVRAAGPVVQAAIRRELEMSLHREARAATSALQSDLLRLVVSRLRPALRESVTDLWKFRTGPADEFSFRRAVRLSEKHVAEVADFIQDLSTLADVLEGRLTNRRTILIEPLVAAVIEQLADRASTSRITLDLRAEEVYVAAVGDWSLLRRAVGNLLDNALRFTPAGGTITIRVVTPDTFSVVIQIADTGRGMTADQLELLSRNRSGPGDSNDGGPQLGWRLASAIVAAHGGTLTASSDGQGRGSTVTIQLPSVQLGESNRWG